MSELGWHFISLVIHTCFTAIMVPRRVSLARKQEQNAPVPISFPFTQSLASR